MNAADDLSTYIRSKYQTTYALVITMLVDHSNIYPKLRQARHGREPLSCEKFEKHVIIEWTQFETFTEL